MYSMREHYSQGEEGGAYFSKIRITLPTVVYHACVPLPFVSFRLKQPAALDFFDEKKWLSRFGAGCLFL